MSEIPDPIEALCAFLAGDADVGELVGDRVFGGELPEDEAESMPQAAIVVNPSGPGHIGSGYQLYGDKRLDVLCYAATPYAANRVYRRVYPALTQLVRVVEAGCLIHWARHAGGPLALRDPNTDWPYTFSSFQVLVAEVPAS